MAGEVKRSQPSLMAMNVLFDFNDLIARLFRFSYSNANFFCLDQPDWKLGLNSMVSQPFNVFNTPSYLIIHAKHTLYNKFYLK